MVKLNNSITFGGINSADYGIFISGAGVYNSPERDVTMVTIPGRNGELTLDNGRFNNVELTYPAFVDGKADGSIREKITAFRNAIGALTGYQRLEDTYNPDEYRSAIFVAGLAVDPVIYQTGGEFEITFNCKPQRWLTSGEPRIGVRESEQQTIEGNPVIFGWNSSATLDAVTVTVPLYIKGYGTPSPNNYREITSLARITVDANDGADSVDLSLSNYSTFIAGTLDGKMGTYTPEYLARRFDGTETWTKSGAGYFYTNTGYSINTSAAAYCTLFKFVTSSSTLKDGEFTLTASGQLRIRADQFSTAAEFAEWIAYDLGSKTLTVAYKPATVSSVGLSGGYISTLNKQDGINVYTIESSDQYGNSNPNMSMSLTYTGPTIITNPTLFEAKPLIIVTGSGTLEVGGATITVDNSVDSDYSGTQTYIDADLDEAWGYDLITGEIINKNKAITMSGADFPTLKPGGNLIYFSGISQIEIVPRWWRI